MKGVRRGGGGGESGDGTKKASGTDLRGGRTNGNKNIEPLTDVMTMMSSVRITSYFIHQWILCRLPLPLPGTLCVRGRVRRRKIDTNSHKHFPTECCVFGPDPAQITFSSCPLQSEQRRTDS